MKSSVRNKPFGANLITITRNVDDYNSAIFFKDVFPTNVSIYGIQYSDGSDYINLPDIGDIDSPNGPTGNLGLGLTPFLNYEFTTFPEILPP